LDDAKCSAAQTPSRYFSSLLASDGGKIERTFAWLDKFKRIITRWDRCIERYTAFVHRALAMILLRRHL
jgi:transposase